MAALLYAEPAVVRVRLFSIQQPSEIRITTETGETTLIDARTLAAPFRTNGRITIQPTGSESVSVRYPIEVSVRKGSLYVVTELPLEDYVTAVLAGESSNFRSAESLKAMAVAIRTYATHFSDRHKGEGFNFCDTTHCQDLRISAITENLRAAADATRDEVLMYRGAAIPAYYHQDCGGISEPRAPYLRQMTDEFCASHGRMKWSADLTENDLHTALGMTGVQRIEIVEHTSSGRAQKLKITGNQVRTIDAEAFRLSIGRTLGWNRILSDLYEVRGVGEHFVFEGYGAGHGIGLCQNGAAAMGELGHSYREILAHYYPNTTIGRSNVWK
jgi:stage II sporulation protein D